jgi:transcriptional antiterminator RfaH
MPLLPLEPFVFPNDLLTNPESNTRESSLWWVLHTKPRAEKALARHLVRHAVSFFLPLHQRQWENRGRSFRAFAPLFPGYVFLLGDNDSRLETLKTKLVANCLPVADQGQLQEDLTRVFHLIASGSPLWPEERLVPGSWVEITCGALTGLQGKILRKGKSLRFYVEVRLIQRAVSVEVADWMIRPLAERRPPCPAPCSRIRENSD